MLLVLTAGLERSSVCMRFRLRILTHRRKRFRWLLLDALNAAGRLKWLIISTAIDAAGADGGLFALLRTDALKIENSCHLDWPPF